jgi:3-oxoacyl-[acyl-carrier-protein] synthase II
MRRVVVTGLGMVTPLGCGVEESWSNLLAGKSGAIRISEFPVADLAARLPAPFRGRKDRANTIR